RAPRTSALARELPAGPTYDAPIEGRMGVLASPSAEAITEAADLIARIAQLGNDATDAAAKRAAVARALAFDEIAARHPVVVEDGAAALATLPPLGTLAEHEQHVLAAVVQRADLPSRVRVAVVRAIGAQHLTALAGTLRALPAP